MQILITGGLGNVGRSVVREFSARGHTLRILDRAEHSDIPGVDYYPCDIANFAALRPLMDGVEAVVHLAAIPAPMMAPPSELFHINTVGTFNVFQAAVEAGIQRIVSASSINFLGFNYGLRSFQLSYFPIDENHPGFSTDAYSFSKQITEQIGDYYWRRDGLSSLHLRLAGVYDASEFPEEEARKYLAGHHQVMEELLSRPQAERQEIIQRALARFDASRPERIRPVLPGEDAFSRWESLGEDPDLMAAGFGFGGHSNFWTAVDARDVAQACEKSLLAEVEGSHPLFINDSHNLAGVETEQLLQVFFPEVTQRTRPIRGTETAVSIDQARALIGFEPQYSVSRFS